MMKKLLVLSLVLVMAGLLNAAMTITSDKDVLMPSEYATITIASDAPRLGGWYGFGAIVYLDGTAEWTGEYAVGAGSPQGPTFEVTQYGNVRPDLPFDDAWYVDMSTPSITPVPAINYITFQLHCTGPGSVDVVVTDESGAILDSLTITQVAPEPATMLLLGLGGLLLRRKK